MALAGGENEPSEPKPFALRGRSLRLALALGAASIASALPAQVPPQVQPPTREEVERPLPPRRDQAERPEVVVEDNVERAPCTLARPEYQDIRFTLTEAVFENLRGLTTEDMRPAWAPFAGREQPVSVICDIRDRAAQILNDAGYVAAIEIPEQRIGEGQVRFNVLMARLVGLRVRGDAGRNERMIARYLEHLTGQEVFNRFEAERYLLLAGDLPGHRVRLALRSAGAGPGEVIGEVIVQRVPGVADVTVQNYGSQEVGPWGVLLRGQLFGLTGLGDRTALSLFTTPDFSEQQTVQLAHDFRVGGEGLAIAGQATYAWAQPDLGDPTIEFESRTFFATLEASYPFVRRLASTLRGSVGLDWVDQDVRFNGLDFTRDRLRVGFARLAWDHLELARTAGPIPVEPPFRASLVIEARHGMGLLGASDSCGPALAACLVPGRIPPARLEGDPTAFVLRGSAYGEYRPAPDFAIVAGLRAQRSASPLFSFEEFSAGNYTIGRGYDPGTLLGDSGLGIQAELRQGGLLPTGPRDLALQAFAFFDQAWISNEDLIPGFPDDEVTSMGLGVRAAWGERVRLEALLAFPLDRTTIEPDRDPRLLVTVTTSLWPWSF